MRFYDPFSPERQHFGKDVSLTRMPWLLTIADLLSLILTFFVMLFAMSTLKPDDWEKVNQSLYQASKNPIDDTMRLHGDDASVERITLIEGRNLSYLHYTLQNKLETLDLPYRFHHEGAQLVLSVPLADIAQGHTLSAHGLMLLSSISQAVAQQQNDLAIRTLAAEGGKTAWEDTLALSRQATHIFHEAGYLAPIPAEAALLESDASPRMEIIIRETVAKFISNR